MRAASRIQRGKKKEKLPLPDWQGLFADITALPATTTHFATTQPVIVPLPASAETLLLLAKAHKECVKRKREEALTKWVLQTADEIDQNTKDSKRQRTPVTADTIISKPGIPGPRTPPIKPPATPVFRPSPSSSEDLN